MPVQAQSTKDLMGMTPREYILLAGKDGAGKSSAIVSMAKFVQDVLNPEATFWVIDTENKFPTAIRSFGADAPSNIAYYKTETMNEVTDVIDEIMSKRKAGDWLAAESMGRIWERAQDMGYRAVSGYDKVHYLEKRRDQRTKGQAQAAVIPSPDQFWSVVKGAHDSAFMDTISQEPSLNIILSTTVTRPPKGDGMIKENETRKAARVEFGLDAGLDGAPRLPTYVETTVLLDLNMGRVSCRVLRDNLNSTDNNRPTFDVPDKKAWAMSFWTNCR